MALYPIATIVPSLLIYLHIRMYGNICDSLRKGIVARTTPVVKKKVRMTVCNTKNTACSQKRTRALHNLLEVYQRYSSASQTKSERLSFRKEVR